MRGAGALQNQLCTFSQESKATFEWPFVDEAAVIFKSGGSCPSAAA